jgi:hypothetical protein
MEDPQTRTVGECPEGEIGAQIRFTAFHLFGWQGNALSRGNEVLCRSSRKLIPNGFPLLFELPRHVRLTMSEEAEDGTLILSQGKRF